MTEGLKIKYTCPLGHECEQVRTNAEESYIERCMWFEELRGKDPVSGEDINTRKCAMLSSNLLQTQISKQLHHLLATTQAFRNEVVVPLIQKDDQQLLEKDANLPSE